MGDRQKGNVFRTRVKKAIEHFKKVRRLQRAVMFAARRIVYQGILPGLLYGVEHSVISDSVWTELRKKVVSALIGRLPSVHHKVALLCLKSDDDPMAKAVASIIMRFAEETWNRARGIGMAGGFSENEVKEIAGLLERTDSVKGHGPLKALQWALSKVGWSIHGTEIRGTDGRAVAEMTFASPTMIKSLVYKAWEEVQWLDAQDYLVEGPWDRWVIRRVCKGTSGLSRVRWCQLLVGHLPTRQWASRHRESVQPGEGGFDECCLCGQCDNTDHRLAGCFIWENEARTPCRMDFWASTPSDLKAGLGDVSTQHELKDLVNRMRWGEKKTKFPETECRVDGQVVDFSQFKWEGGHAVFTDGSASFVGTPVSVGGAGAYQVARQGLAWSIRSMRLTVPVELEASAVLSEHWAFWAASSIPTRDGSPLQIVSDCAAVAKQRLCDNITKSTKQFGGFFENWRRVLPVRWVRSHLTVEQGIKQGFSEEDIQGNAWADFVAGDASACVFDHHNRGNFDWMLAGTHTVRSIIENMDRVAVGKFDAYEGMSAKQPAFMFKMHEWTKHGHRWRCTACGLSAVKPKKNVKQHCFGPFEQISHIHPSHRTARIGFDDGSRCVACVGCGHYAVTRFVKLAQRCSAQGAAGCSKSGKRLRRGLHPESGNRARIETMVPFDPVTLRVARQGWGSGGFVRGGSTRAVAGRSWRLMRGVPPLSEAKPGSAGGPGG